MNTILVNKLKEISSKLSVLFVEDEANIRKNITSMLQELFAEVATATNGAEGLTAYYEKSFDIVLTDISMPEVNGIIMSRAIKQENPEQKIIIITAHQDMDCMLEAIQLNIDGFILKPLDNNQFFETLFKVCNAIKDSKELKLYRENLEELVLAKTEELRRLNLEIEDTLQETIMSLGGIAEARSQETGNHCRRVAEYTDIIAKGYGMSAVEAELLKLVSPMHDVGKLGVPDDILHKPHALNESEFEVIKTHSTIGYEMLKNSEREIFKAASIIAYEHHENYDGSGYPRGLEAEQIHIYGRITALADVFDALSHDRVYKTAWPLDDVFDFINENKGGKFDPTLTDIFLSKKDEIVGVKEHFC